MPSPRNSRPQAPAQVLSYQHQTDPRAPFKLAKCLGRAVAFGFLTVDAGLDAMTVAAVAEVKRTRQGCDPTGLHGRMSWALRDAASDTARAADLFPGQLMRALIERLRGQTARLTDEQAAQAQADLEALIMQVATKNGSPFVAGELDAIAVGAYRAAARIVARERRQ